MDDSGEGYFHTRVTIERGNGWIQKEDLGSLKLDEI